MARANPIDVVLYTRRSCHLCEDARAVLEKHLGPKGAAIREIDIDGDPDLRQQYDDCVPVVAIDGVVRFRGRVNEVLLRRLIG